MNQISQNFEFHERIIEKNQAVNIRVKDPILELRYSASLSPNTYKVIHYLRGKATILLSKSKVYQFLNAFHSPLFSIISTCRHVSNIGHLVHATSLQLRSLPLVCSAAKSNQCRVDKNSMSDRYGYTISRCS